MRAQAAVAKHEVHSSASTKQAIVALYVALSVAYLAIALFLPPDKKALAKYQISPAAVKALSLVIALPLIAIWGAGFYGFYRYDRYAHTIRKTKDGVYHQSISSGLFVLALSLPVSSIVSNLLSYYGREYPKFMPSSVIIGNYVTIALYLCAFAFIYQGITGLLHITGKTLRERGEIYLMMGFTVVVGLFYYLSLHNPARQFPTGSLSTAAYYLPDWLIVFTILIPYTILWYLGVMSAFRLWLYRNNVQGEIYRRAFTQLAIGLGMVVALLMVLRYLTALVTILDKLSLKYLLLTIYILLIFIAVGYVFIAIGAKRLKKIEEV